MIDADENVFRKEKVTKEDDGYYFAIVNSIKSNITKVTVHCKLVHIFICMTLSMVSEQSIKKY